MSYTLEIMDPDGKWVVGAEGDKAREWLGTPGLFRDPRAVLDPNGKIVELLSMPTVNEVADWQAKGYRVATARFRGPEPLP